MSAGEKWRPFFRREDTPEQITRNIGAEFNAHLELRIEQLKAEGLSEEEARIRAVALLGDAGRAARLCERTDRTWLWRDRLRHVFESIVSDVLHALRLFRTNPIFTCMASLCLAVGITFITTTYTILDNTLIQPLPYEDADELVMVGQVESVPADWNWLWSSYPDFQDWEAQNHVFERLALFNWRICSITDLDDPVRLSGCEVTEAFDDVLGIKPLLGRTFMPYDFLPGAEPVILLGHGIWQRAYGGDPNIIGRRITLDGEFRHQVVGIMPPHFTFPDFQEVWVPLRREEPGPRTSDGFITFGRLREGVSIEAAKAEMRQIGARLAEVYPENQERGEVRVVSYGPFLFRSLRTPLLVIFFAACLVLLLACSNLTNLMLSRAADRIREFSVRAVLGAGRFRLVQQVMIESLVIALVGGAIGIILGRLGLNLLLTNLPRSVPGFLQFDINLQVLTPLVGIIALSGLTFGLTPAFAVRRKALGVSLRSDAVRMSPGKKQSLTRSSLVVLQIGLATVILAVTGLVMGSYLESRVHGLGVDTDHLLGQYLSLPQWGYPTPESRLTFFTDGVERLRNRPGIEAVAYISQAPAARNDSWTTLCTAETAANSEYPFLRSRIRVVSPGYFATAGIPLLAGRDLAASDTGERTRIGLVNRTLARTVWGDSDPVGRSFFWSREPDPERIVQVVGMVDDVRHGGPGEEAGPCFYIPLDPSTARSDGWLMVRSAGDPKAVAPVLRGTIRDLDPQLAMSAPRTIIELAQEKNWRTIIVTWILSVIAVFALLLALIGIVGVVACEVANRRHEFGIRLAMGADSRSILRNVMGRGGRMAGIGIAAGLVVTLVAMRFLSGFLGSAEFRDPFVYLVVVSFLLATTLLASYLPASRIGRIDPVEVLREE